MTYFHITLNTGREVRLDELIQYYTYAGLIEGKPNVKMNKRVIERTIQTAKTKLSFNDGEPIIISPRETLIELDDREIDGWRDLYDKDRKKLPGIICLSGWNCYSPAQDEDKMGSYLKIIWFQNELAMPIDELIIKQIKSIDWENNAVDYDI